MSESLIPRPEPNPDVIMMNGGIPVVFTTETATVVEHANGYEYMDHLHVHNLGKYGLRLFNIRATPIYDALVAGGYDRLLKQYPSDETVTVYLDMQSHTMEQELGGTGSELDE